jgi:hypothetical protein
MYSGRMDWNNAKLPSSNRLLNVDLQFHTCISWFFDTDKFSTCSRYNQVLIVPRSSKIYIIILNKEINVSYIYLLFLLISNKI